mmetsp:Transcript_36820/g.84832  ORF Transcript_36820/g.84832 Transcript_36820/m.84832 type:complete len:289 (+) Transcript_36820:69-935(+)
MGGQLLWAWSACAIVVTLGSTPRNLQSIEVDASASVRREARPLIDTSDLVLSGFVDDSWGQSSNDQADISSSGRQNEASAWRQVQTASGQPPSEGRPEVLVDFSPPAPSPMADKDRALRHAVQEMAADSKGGQHDHPIGYVKPVPLGPPQHYYGSAPSTVPPALQRVGATAVSTTAQPTTAKIIAVPSTSTTSDASKRDDGLGLLSSIVLVVVVCCCSCLSGGLLAVLLGHSKDQSSKGGEDAEDAGTGGFADEYAYATAGAGYGDVDPGADADDDTGGAGVVSSDEG